MAKLNDSRTAAFQELVKLHNLPKSKIRDGKIKHLLEYFEAKRLDAKLKKAIKRGWSK